MEIKPTAATVGDLDFVCPFPDWWYPPESPCAHSNDFHIRKNDPAIGEADRERFRQRVNPDDLSWVLWIGLGVVVLYFGIRGMEAYATIKSAG